MKRSLVIRIALMVVLVAGALGALVLIVERVREAGSRLDREEALEQMGVAPSSGQAEPFELETLEGETLALEDLEGRLVFLNFWATWCEPCVREMPAMQRVADRFEDDDFEMVAVNVREEREQAAQFVEELDLSFTVLMDLDGAVTNRMNVRGIPTTFLIGPDGARIGTRLGYHDWDEEATIEAFEALLDQV